MARGTVWGLSRQCPLWLRRAQQEEQQARTLPASLKSTPEALLRAVGQWARCCPIFGCCGLGKFFARGTAAHQELLLELVVLLLQLLQLLNATLDLRRVGNCQPPNRTCLATPSPRLRDDPWPRATSMIRRCPEEQLTSRAATQSDAKPTR